MFWIGDDLKNEIRLQVSLYVSMNRMREPLFMATTEHANWDQKEIKI